MKSTMIGAIVLFLFSGCSMQPLVQTDYNRDARFDLFISFRLAEDVRKPEGQSENFNDLVTQRIQTALVSEMKGRGYQYVDNQQPDLVVSFFMKVEEKVNYRQNPYGGGWGWGGGGSVPYFDKESTLTINLVDARAAKLVWQGYVTSDFQGKPEVRDRKIREAISMIFAEYPYRAPVRPSSY